MKMLVLADDRTGALETAAVIADRSGHPVRVIATPAAGPIAIDTSGSSDVLVVDIATRHLSPDVARDRVLGLLADPSAIEVVGVCRRAHKIDSTLRGNWPEELAAHAARAPVLVVPALPQHGRTCVAGEVLELGRPVHEGPAGSDVRRRVSTSRPADLLVAAGVKDVHLLATLDDVSAWLDAPTGVAVADAVDDATIDDIVDRWQRHGAGTVLAGTSAVIGAAGGTGAFDGDVPAFDPPVLVVCGSAHPAARAQVADAEQQGFPVVSLVDDLTVQALTSADALVLTTEIPVGDVDAPIAVATISALARGVDDLLRRVDIGALVLIGGDTAAAVLRTAPATVLRSLGPGTALVSVDALDVPVITRAGGFGNDRAIADLVRSVLRR